MLLALNTLVTWCVKDKTTTDNKTTVEVNNNEEITKDQNIEGITITNTSLVYEDGISYLKATAASSVGIAKYEFKIDFGA